MHVEFTEVIGQNVHKNNGFRQSVTRMHASYAGWEASRLNKTVLFINSALSKTSTAMLIG